MHSVRAWDEHQQRIGAYHSSLFFLTTNRLRSMAYVGQETVVL